MANAEEKRDLTLPSGDKVVLKKPGMQDHKEAEWEYARTFNEAIRAGIVPRSILLQQLRDLGVWTAKDDDRTVELEEAMGEALTTLQEAADGGDKDAYEAARGAVARSREELITHNAKLNSFLNNCAEEKASESRIFYLAYACTMTLKGERYWKDFGSYKSDPNPSNVNAAYLNFMLFINGLSANIVDSLPENQIKLRDADDPKSETEDAAA